VTGIRNYLSALRRALLIVLSIPMILVIALIGLLYSPIYFLTRDRQPARPNVQYANSRGVN